jgi:rRNA processing protein Krr1/Pno1
MRRLSGESGETKNAIRENTTAKIAVSSSKSVGIL